jgi:hypothetical protein
MEARSNSSLHDLQRVQAVQTMTIVPIRKAKIEEGADPERLFKVDGELMGN